MRRCAVLPRPQWPPLLRHQDRHILGGQVDLGGSRQVAGQAELLPVLLAKWVLSGELRSRPVLIFVDNDPARYGLASGSSPAECSAELLSASAAADCELGLFPWVARVPSWSNIADVPSRLNFDEIRGWPGARASSLCLPSGAKLNWEGVVGQLALERNGDGD